MHCDWKQFSPGAASNSSMAKKKGDRNAKPRIAHGSGGLPTHVHHIFHNLDDSFRIEIHDARSRRSRWGFYPSLKCANQAEFDAQMEILLAARIPFMVGHMIQGPSDNAYFWLQDKGRPIDYLEIFCGGRTAWGVREIIGDAKEWQGAKLSDLLIPPIDLFDPANRPRPVIVPSRSEPVAPESPQTAAPPAEAPPAAPDPIVEAPPSTAAEPTLPPEPTDGVPQIAEAPSIAVLPAPTSARESARPGRWIQNAAHTTLVLILALALYRLTEVIRIQVQFDVSSVVPAVLQWALAGSTVYIAFWLTAFPRAFPGWRVRLVLMANSFLIAIMTAFAMLFIINIEQDRSAVVVVPAEVLHKMVYKGKYGRDAPAYWRYILVVRSWQDDTGEEPIRVGREYYEAITPGNIVSFRLHPGRLGWFWYTDEESTTPSFVEILK